MLLLYFVVGANPNGHASRSTCANNTTSEFLANVDSGFPTTQINLAPMRRNEGKIPMISPVSPLLEKASYYIIFSNHT